MLSRVQLVGLHKEIALRKGELSEYVKWALQVELRKSGLRMEVGGDGWLAEAISLVPFPGMVGRSRIGRAVDFFGLFRCPLWGEVRSG